MDLGIAISNQSISLAYYNQLGAALTVDDVLAAESNCDQPIDITPLEIYFENDSALIGKFLTRYRKKMASLNVVTTNQYSDSLDKVYSTTSSGIKLYRAHLNAIYLRKVIGDLKVSVNDTVDSAVVCFPSFYDDAQLNSLKTSVNLINLNVSKLIPADVAVCLALKAKGELSVKEVIIVEAEHDFISLSHLNVSGEISVVKRDLVKITSSQNIFHSLERDLLNRLVEAIPDLSMMKEDFAKVEMNDLATKVFNQIRHEKSSIRTTACIGMSSFDMLLDSEYISNLINPFQTLVSDTANTFIANEIGNRIKDTKVILYGPNAPLVDIEKDGAPQLNIKNYGETNLPALGSAWLANNRDFELKDAITHFGTNLGSGNKHGSNSQSSGTISIKPRQAGGASKQKARARPSGGQPNKRRKIVINKDQSPKNTTFNTPNSKRTDAAVQNYINSLKINNLS